MMAKKLKVTKAEHKALIAFCKESVEEFRQEDFNYNEEHHLWYGAHVIPDGRMFDINISRDEDTIFCTAYVCIPCNDEGTENWTTDCSKSLYLWEEKV